VGELQGGGQVVVGEAEDGEDTGLVEADTVVEYLCAPGRGSLAWPYPTRLPRQVRRALTDDVVASS
jgi:hypothetical protein